MGGVLIRNSCNFCDVFRGGGGTKFLRRFVIPPLNNNLIEANIQ